MPDGPDEIGEIAIKGHNIMKGYYDRPEATAEVDPRRLVPLRRPRPADEDGWYYIVDRSKDMIIRGGYNVYPREIEEVLMTHEAVSLAAVIGVPHESHGEEIKAVLILNDGRRGHRGRAGRLGQGADGGLQVPARWWSSSTPCR